MKAFVSLARGAVIEKNGKRYVISNHLDLESLLCKNEETGASEVLQIKDIKPVSTLNGSEEAEHLELSLIDEVDWSGAEGWYTKLRPLMSGAGRTRAEVKKLADEAGVHVATVYRKLSILDRLGRVSALVKPKPTGGRGKKRLTPEVDAVIDATIDDFYFNRDDKKRTKAETIDEVEHRLRNAKLPLPHRLTTHNRIVTADRERRRRHLAERAKFDQTTSPAQSLGANHPLAIIQIDHTPLDLMVVDDEHRLNCGKPWITLAIDVYSRMVMGFYISLDPPGNTGTGQCIAHAVLAKEAWLAGLDISIPWPCWGFMDKIHADNAGEFRGNMLKRGCKEYGIDLEWRPVRQPQYGSHIERLLGTFLKEIHKLPGSTESNPGERGAYDAEKHAAMTMSELEKWLALYIAGVYHQKLHSGLGTTPIKRYEQGIFGTDKVLGRGYPLRVNDEDRLRLDLLPAFSRTIQDYGVQLDVIRYKSGVLRRWANAPDPDNPKDLRKFIFKRYPRDISALYFYDPDLKNYFKVPYSDLAHPPMSIWEYRKVRKFLRETGVKEVDERLIFETHLQLRAMVAESTHKSKKARRDEQRHKMNSCAPKPRAPEDLPDNGIAKTSPKPTPRSKDIRCFEEIEM